MEALCERGNEPLDSVKGLSSPTEYLLTFQGSLWTTAFVRKIRRDVIWIKLA
jgi:hypothetical protein